MAFCYFTIDPNDKGLIITVKEFANGRPPNLSLELQGREESSKSIDYAFNPNSETWRSKCFCSSCRYESQDRRDVEKKNFATD